jgi:cation transport regulator ChaB
MKNENEVKTTEIQLPEIVSEKLNDKQRQLIPLIISFGNIEKACKKAEVGRATFYLWLKDNNFVMELRAQQETIYNQAIIGLQMLLNKAIEVYQALLDSKDDALRFRAASAVIENTIKLTEQKELKDRLDKIEEALERKGK